jgi:excisionase family DNA binding protein
MKVQKKGKNPPLPLQRGPLLTYREVQELLKISGATLYKMIDEGKLPVVRLRPRICRIRSEDVFRLFHPSPPKDDA